jgi:hypothetical protein
VDNRTIRDGAEIATRDTEEIIVASNCSPHKVYLILVTFSTKDEDLPFPQHKVAGHISRLDEHDAEGVMLRAFLTLVSHWQFLLTWAIPEESGVVSQSQRD